MVKRSDSGGVVGHEHEVAAVVGLHPRTQPTLTFGVEVTVGARNLIAALGHDLTGLGERDAGERRGRHAQIDAERSLDRGAVLLDDRREPGDQKIFVHLHDVVVRVDPADLSVDRREFGRVPGGERGVGAKGRGNLEHLAEAGGLRHLLEELRALGEVGLRLEILDLEQLGAAL